jgi:glycerophosphoryl diester phosphodiesterase
MVWEAVRCSRRNLLRGAGVIGLSTLAGGAVAGCSGGQQTATEFLTEDHYFIAHRGSGDEAPEHTLAAYTYAVDRGARAIEISVHRTQDGVLVCHHDFTLERTCGGFPGAIKDMTFAELADHPVDMTRWVGPNWGRHPVPRLDDVLDEIGGRTIVFVEPKDPAARADVIRTITDRGLQDATVFKQHYMFRGDEAARRAGLAVWNYYDLAATAADIEALASRSDGIGAEANNDPLDPDRIALIKAAVATGKPVIAWAVHRRHQVDQLAGLGVRGFMASSWSYLAQEPAPERRDGFSDGRVRPGDLPSSQGAQPGLAWNSDNSIAMVDASGPQSLSMGSMCPLPSNSYSLAFEMRFDSMPMEKSQHAGVVIGRDNDAPYRFGISGPSSGQLVILRANGSLELRQVPPDNGTSAVIAQAPGEPVFPARWESIEIRTRGEIIEITRTPTDGRPTTIRGAAPNTGEYFALTRNYGGDAAAVRFRRILISDAAY